MKYLILVSVMASALVGCGGGSSSDATFTPSTQINQNLYNTSYDYNDSSSRYDMFFTEHNIKNNRISYPSERTDQYILTSAKLFHPNDVVTASAELKSLTNWTLTEYGVINTYIQFDEIALNGLSIYDTAFSGYNNFLNTLLTLAADDTYNRYPDALRLQYRATQKFGANSTCYRVKTFSTPSDQFYFSFDTSPNSERQNTYDQQWQILNNVKALETEGNTVTIKQGTWNGYRWMYIQTKSDLLPEFNIQYGFVELNNKIYIAELNGNENYSLSDLNKDLKQRILQENDPLTLASLNLQLEQNEKGCFLYNQAAANELNSFIK